MRVFLSCQLARQLLQHGRASRLTAPPFCRARSFPPCATKKMPSMASRPRCRDDAAARRQTSMASPQCVANARDFAASSQWLYRAAPAPAPCLTRQDFAAESRGHSRGDAPPISGACARFGISALFAHSREAAIMRVARCIVGEFASPSFVDTAWRAPAPLARVAKRARDIYSYRRLRGLAPVSISPSAVGGVDAAARVPAHHLYIGLVNMTIFGRCR